MVLLCCSGLAYRQLRAYEDDSKQNVQEVQLSYNRASVNRLSGGGRALESEIEMQIEAVP
jgi:hypothetical protein